MKRLDPRSVMIGFLIAVIGLMSIAATPTDGKYETLTVKKLKLFDDKGLVVYSSNNKPIMGIYYNEGGGIEIYNDYNIATIQLKNFGDAGMVGLLNAQGKTTALAGESGISLHNEKGEARMTLSANSGGGKMTMLNKHEKTMMYLGAGPDDNCFLSLHDKDGQAQWLRQAIDN